MNIVIWLLTAFLVLNCLLLILLVLIQLPKKEAGLGQAFGGGTTDALFGAGSGNVLTKLTKYGTVAFFVSTLLISILQGQQARARSGDPRLKLSMEERLSATPKPAPAATPATPATNTALTATSLTNQITLDTNLIKLTTTNAASQTTNAAAPK